MTPRLWTQYLRRLLVPMFLAISLAACANGPRLVSHSFSFDGLSDHWAESVDLLAYAYGDGYHMVREDLSNPSSSALANRPGLPAGRSINGPMPVGEFLYVKWRVKSTGEVVEQRVDLRDRLPTDMNDRELTFVLEGAQLYVFVVTPVARKPWGKVVTHKTWLSAYRVTYEIYPNKEVN